MISKKSLKTFSEIYGKEFGEHLSEKETEDMVNKLICLYRAVFGDPLLSDGLKNKKYGEQ